MNVLHIITGLNVGGAEMSLKRLIEYHQSQSEFKHRVISLTDIGPLGKELQASGISVISINMRSALALPSVIWRLRSLIRQIQPDIVQTWMYHADLIGGIAARLAGCRRVIWGIRNTGLSSRLSLTSMIRWCCVPLSYFIPTKIVCVAEAARLSHRRMGYCAKKMLVINNGFLLDSLQASDEQRQAIRQLTGATEQQLLIGMVGRFNPIKDHLNFIQAAQQVRQHVDNVRFVLVGKDCDQQNKQLTAWLSEYAMTNDVSLLGQRKDIPACLAAMDIFCSASRQEGFPNVVGEAMAMEKPCVVTDAGDSALLVGEAGMVVPVSDPQALAQGLLDMIHKSSQARQILAKQSRQRIIDHFTLARTVENYEQLYRSC